MHDSTSLTTGKTCAHSWCKASFDVTQGDLDFLERLSPVLAGKKEPIPPPTLCPECRLQRRLSWRNEHNLYRRTCDRTGEPILSLYSSDKPSVVYEQKEWWKDTWDPLEYGRPFDFSRPFFEQFAELQHVVPRMSVLQEHNENSDFTSNVSHLKDCYLLFSADFNRDCCYGVWVERCRDCLDNYLIDGCEQTYESFFSQKLHHSSFAEYSAQCRDSAFLFDCRGCADCFLCTGLRNKQYYIENTPHSREDYFARRAQFPLSSYQNLLKAKQRFGEMVKDALRPPLWKRGSILNSTGDLLIDVENCMGCFEVTEGRDCSSVFAAFKIKDIVSCNHIMGELAYENCECFPTPTHAAFDMNCYSGSDLYYCDHCMNNCQNLFGCVGLKHAQYCVLNVQYTKEEYEKLVPKIIDHMRRTGEWGEFPPTNLSVFAYNESEAADTHPLAREEVEKRGWKWREAKEEPPKVSKVIPAAKLPDAIDDIPDDIVNWAIECEATKRPFKIIKQELEFYREMGLPIPHFHPDERHRRRMALRNPRHLWERACAKCRKNVETTYAPGRPEKVLCEECYLKEVY